MNPINILFNGSAEVLNIVGRGDPLIDSLITPNENLCPLIGAEIKLDKELGKGVGGTVFEIMIPGKGTKKYAVKRGGINMSSIFIQRPLLENDDRLIDIGVSLKILKAFNPKIDFNEETESWMHIPVHIPESSSDIPIKECLIRAPKSYTAIPYIAGGIVEAPSGSYLCTNESYSEYYIGVLLGNAYRTEKCINFFDVYSMFICKHPDIDDDTEFAYDQYILMDKIDNAEGNILQCISMKNYNKIKGHSRDIQDGVFIQTMFAIAFYQSQYKISHNDLHEDNVFVEFVKNSDESKGIIGTTFNGEYLYECDSYHYRIGNIDLYLPAIPVIVKIGDFGMSIKYSHPIVGDEYIFKTGYATQGDPWGPWMPNHFIPQYDSVYHTVRYVDSLSTKSGHQFMGDLLADSIKYLMPTVKNHLTSSTVTTSSTIKFLGDTGLINRASKRPKLERLSICRTAYDLLTSPVMNKYRTKPTSGKIVTLGVI